MPYVPTPNPNTNPDFDLKLIFNPNPKTKRQPFRVPFKIVWTNQNIFTMMASSSILEASL